MVLDDIHLDFTIDDSNNVTEFKEAWFNISVQRRFKKEY